MVAMTLRVRVKVGAESVDLRLMITDHRSSRGTSTASGLGTELILGSAKSIALSKPGTKRGIPLGMFSAEDGRAMSAAIRDVLSS